MRRSGGHLDFNIRVWMTPADLRQIADEMEEVWSEVSVGDNLCVRDWHLDERTTLTFAIDQERMLAALPKRAEKKEEHGL